MSGLATTERPQCARCPHQSHLGPCLKRNGQTAHQCPCILDTVPASPDPLPHLELLEDVQVTCEGCGTAAFLQRRDVLVEKSWACLTCGRSQRAKAGA